MGFVYYLAIASAKFVIFLRFFNQKINSLQEFSLFLQMSRQWMYFISWMFILNFLIQPCSYIALTLDILNVMFWCNEELPETEHLYFGFWQILGGLIALIIIALAVLTQHFNKMVHPARITVALYLLLMITYAVSAFIPF